MTSSRLVAVLVLISGCASAAASPSEPVACKRSDRHGTYLVSFSIVSGNCGAIPATLVNSDDAGNACAATSVSWSEGDCKLESAVNCNGSHAVGVVTQRSADGSYLDGTFSMQTTTCIGTYDVRYTRQ